MTAKSHLGMDIVVEAQEDEIDHYYKILKERGLYDFVSEIVPPRYRVEGVRVDTELNYPLTVKTNKICVTNVLNLIGQIKLLGYVKNDLF